MEKTTDFEENATKEFFETHGLEQALSEFFGGDTVKETVAEGYRRFRTLMTEAKESAPEEAKELANKLLEKVNMTEQEFAQSVVDITRDKLGEIIMPVAVFIPVSESIQKLLQEKENEYLMILVTSAMDEIIQGSANRFANMAILVINGVPLEIAEKISYQIGNAEVIPFGVEIVCKEIHDDNEDTSEGCTCGGECGGNCTCGQKDGCEGDGHCQCGENCKCGKHADK